MRDDKGPDRSSDLGFIFVGLIFLVGMFAIDWWHGHHPWRKLELPRHPIGGPVDPVGPDESAEPKPQRVIVEFAGEGQ